MASHTIGSGIVISAEYVIPSGAGAGFTLVNYGVIADMAGTDGVVANPSSPSILNHNGIAGNPSTGRGIVLLAGGFVSNATAGIIYGATGVYATGAAAKVVNSGKILAQNTTGGHDGVTLNAGGTVFN